MEPTTIKGANRVLHAPKDWDEARNGPCAALPVIDTGEFFQSCWIPDNMELAALDEGASVVITIWGRNLPPHSVSVTPKPGYIPEARYEQAVDTLRHLLLMVMTARGTAQDPALARACRIAEGVCGELPPDARRAAEDAAPIILPGSGGKQ